MFCTPWESLPTAHYLPRHTCGCCGVVEKLPNLRIEPEIYWAIVAGALTVAVVMVCLWYAGDHPDPGQIIAKDWAFLRPINMLYVHPFGPNYWMERKRKTLERQRERESNMYFRYAHIDWTQDTRDTDWILKWVLVCIAAFCCTSRYHIWIIKIDCPHKLKSDCRELRNRLENLGWVVR